MLGDVVRVREELEAFPDGSLQLLLVLLLLKLAAFWDDIFIAQFLAVVYNGLPIIGRLRPLAEGCGESALEVDLDSPAREWSASGYCGWGCPQG